MFGLVFFQNLKEEMIYYASAGKYFYSSFWRLAGFALIPFSHQEKTIPGWLYLFAIVFRSYAVADWYEGNQQGLANA